MYTNITEYCKNVIGRSSRTFAASFVIGEKKYSDIKSLKVMVPSVANGKITIGGTVSKNVEIIVDKVDVLPGTKICVYEGVKLDTGEYEDVPMGTYKVRSAVTKAHMTTIVAEGLLSTETELGYFSELTYPVTTIQMLEEISEAIGVPIVTDNLEELYVESKPEGYTYREVIGFIAGMHGTNAVEMRDGSIAFKWYEYCEDDIFTDKADAPELSNDTFVIEKFECETGNATIARGAGKTGIVISNPLMTEAAAGALWEKIAGFSYKPATFNIKSGTPLVDEWNYFSYEGESIIATELQFVHDGGLQNTFKSVGESETVSASGYKGPMAKSLERYQAELVIVKEALVNKLSVEEADIRYLQADKLEVITAEVESAVIKNLEGDFATFEALSVTNAQVALLETNKLSTAELSAEVAKLGYATAEQLDASIARIVTLEANQLTVSSLKSDFADITLSNVAVENVGKLFADVGLITSATIKDGHVTGYLDSVEVNANSVTAGTLSVDRLIFRGSENSIVYELNNITGALQAVQSDTLNGEILTDRSITVDKIVAKSITANEIAAGAITATELNVSNIFSNSAVISILTAQEAFINAISTNSIVVGAMEAAQNTCPFIAGTQTAATGTWTGIAPFSELKDGQQITYWLPYNGSGNATLNLTLSDGTTTGAIPCYYNGVNRLTTHYVAGNVIRFTYCVNANISGTSYTGWWADANYDTNTYDRTRYNSNTYAASAIVAGNIIVGDSNGYHHLKTGGSFDVSYPILFASSNINAGSTGSNNYIAIYCNVTATQSISLTARKTVYIKGTLTGNTFTPISTAPLTQTMPTTEDGYTYILLGEASATSNFYLLPDHPIFKYINGAFQQISAGTNAVFENWRTPGTTTIDGGKITTESITAAQIDVASLTAHSAFINAISTNSVVVAAKSAANAAYSHSNNVAANVFVTGTTTINGGNIATGTIKADSIDVGDLFAKAITASNLTITGGIISLPAADYTQYIEVSSTDGWCTGFGAYGFSMECPSYKVMLHSSGDEPYLTFNCLQTGEDEIYLGEKTVRASRFELNLGGSVSGAAFGLAAYPVGAIYISTSSTSPATLFGGTWTQITNRFLVAAGTSFTAGSTGGSTTHTHTLSNNGWAKIHHNNSYFWMHEISLSTEWSDTAKIGSISGNNVSSGDSDSAVGLGGNTDSGSTLPPYLAVYVWKRVA